MLSALDFRNGCARFLLSLTPLSDLMRLELSHLPGSFYDVEFLKLFTAPRLAFSEK